MDEYIDRKGLRKALYDADEITFDGLDIIDNFPAADVITRDEGIRLWAELAAMHGSDATSQDLEKAYWRGFEDAMQKRDVQPVVQCKDCVYRPYYEPPDSKSASDLVFPDYRFNPCPCRVEDFWYSWMPDDDWFCAYGKRKDGEA